MRVTHIRPVPPRGLGYRLGLALHCRHNIDSQLSGLDLRALSRSDTREILSGVERTTGLTSGVLEHDAEPEVDADLDR